MGFTAVNRLGSLDAEVLPIAAATISRTNPKYPT